MREHRIGLDPLSIVSRLVPFVLTFGWLVILGYFLVFGHPLKSS